MTMTASPGSSTRSTISISDTPGKTSKGGGAASQLTTRTSLPRCFKAYAMAICDPTASPSGLTWEAITKRCRLRIASAVCASSPRSAAVVITGGIERRLDVGLGAVRVFLLEVAQDLLDPVLVLDSFVESELDLRDAT